MWEVLSQAAAAGLLLALICGPLGALVVWQRMAYLGETLAHAGLLGIALAPWLHLAPAVSVLLIGVLVTLLLLWLQDRPELSSDSLLGILAYGSLALALIALSLNPEFRTDPSAYLFGDLLTLTRQDLWLTGFGALLLLGWLAWLWKPLLLLCIDAELAASEGLPVKRLRLQLLLMLSLLIALAMKLVGALLITALLVIPAAASRLISQTPLQMALLASLLGGLSVLTGLGSSFYWDLPAGPAIVGASCLIFMLLRLRKSRQDRP